MHHGCLSETYVVPFVDILMSYAYWRKVFFYFVSSLVTPISRQFLIFFHSFQTIAYIPVFQS